MAGRKEFELLFQLKATLGGNFNSTFKSAIDTSKKLQNSLSQLNSLSGKIDGFQKQTDALEKNKQKLADLTAEHDRLQKEMSETGEPSESLKKQMEQNARQIEKTTEAIRQQEARLDTLGSELQAAGIDTDKLSQENEKLAKSFEKVKKSQEELAKINQQIDANNAAISETRAELVKTVGTIAATGAAIYKGFIEPTAEFKSEMSNLTAITGMSADEMATVERGVRQIARDTGTDVMEIASNTKMLAEAGGDLDLLMEQLAHGTNLANATQSDMATTLDFLGSTMKTFGVEAENTQDVVDSFALVTSLANVELSQLGDSYTNAGGAAALAGMSIDEMNAILIQMSNAGLKGGAAGTALNAIIRNLSTPTDKAAKALSGLGVSLYEADGTSRDMLEIMQDLEGSLSGMSDDMRNAAMSAIFDSVALKGWNMIAADGIEEIRGLSEELTTAAGAFDGAGQAAAMAGTQQDNLTGDIAYAKTAWKDLSLTIGDLFMPTARELVQTVTGVINKVNEFVQANPELVKTLATVVGGLAAVKVGSLAGKLGFLEMKGGVLETVKSFLSFKGNMADAAAQAAMGNGKIASLGQSLSGYFGGVKNSLSGLGGSIDSLAGGKLSGLFSKIGGGIDSGILQPLGSLGNKITGALGGAGSKVTGFFSKIGTAVANGPLGKIGGVFQSLGGTVASVLGGPLKGLGSLFGGLFGKAMPLIMIISALSILFLKLSGEDISGFIEPLKEAFEQAKPVLQSVMEQFKALGQKLLPLLMNAAKQLAPLLGEIIAGILPIVLELISAIVPMITNLVETLLPVILDIITTLAPLLTDIITAILPIVLELLQLLLPIITQLVQSVLPIIVEVLNAVLPLVVQLIEAVLPVLMSLLQALMPIIEVLASIFSSVLGSAIQSISGIIEGLTRVLGGVIDFITGVFTGNWSQAWEGIKNIFGGIFDSLAALVKAPINAVISIINGAISGINKVGFTIPDWVPFIGGKDFRINIPEIPMLAKGSTNTPDTFISGEAGAELVTNARGRTVFTAAQTSRIMDNLNAAESVKDVVAFAPALIGAIAAARSGGLQPAYAGVSAPTVTAGGQAAGVVIHSAPVFHVGSDAQAEDIEEILRQRDEDLLNKVDDRMRKKEDDERRGRYD